MCNAPKIIQIVVSEILTHVSFPSNVTNLSFTPTTTHQSKKSLRRTKLKPNITSQNQINDKKLAHQLTHLSLAPTAPCLHPPGNKQRLPPP